MGGMIRGEGGIAVLSSGDERILNRCTGRAWMVLIGRALRSVGGMLSNGDRDEK